MQLASKQEQKEITLQVSEFNNIKLLNAYEPNHSVTF